MKLLKELVQEEIEKRKSKNLMSVEGGIATVNIAAIQSEAADRVENLKKRMFEDIALTELLNFINNHVRILLKFPADNATKEGIFAQILTEAIIIWENANNRFADQLKPHEPNQN